MDQNNLATFGSNTVLQNIDKVHMMWAVNGGWERWFQCELLYTLCNTYALVNLEEKPVYVIDDGTHEREKVDIVVTEPKEVIYQDHVGHVDYINYIELKCLTMTQILKCNENTPCMTFVNSVLEDWTKQSKRKADSLLSLVMIPADISGVGKATKDVLVYYAGLRNMNYMKVTVYHNYEKHMYSCAFQVNPANPNPLYQVPGIYYQDLQNSSNIS